MDIITIIITIICLVIFLAALTYIIFKIKNIMKWLSWLFYWPKKFLSLINPIPKKGETIKGHAQGIWLAVILTTVLSLTASMLFWKLPLPINIYTHLLAYAIIMSVTIPFCFGKRFQKRLETGHCGVPTILGKRLPHFTYDEGNIWQLPDPVMGFVSVNILEREYNMGETIALSNDLIPIIVDFVVRAVIIDPYASTWIDKLDESVKDLGLRESRAFIALNKSKKIPPMRQNLSSYVKEHCNREMSEYSFFEESGEGDAKKEIKTKSWGMHITRIFVRDVRLPHEMEAALIKKQVERALAIANLIRVSNLKKGIRAIKANKFMKMDDREFANIVQTEYATATRIIVDGSDPISRAAAILVSGKKELKEVVK